MTDISKCQDVHCSRKSNCYRQTAPSDYDQSYAGFKWSRENLLSGATVARSFSDEYYPCNCGNCPSCHMEEDTMSNQAQQIFCKHEICKYEKCQKPISHEEPKVFLKGKGFFHPSCAEKEVSK